jgi:tetratricopeptide (TPR) repeat protein
VWQVSSEPDNAAELRQRIAETDAVIAAAPPDTADPEAREMLAEAFRERALALSRLGRHDESLQDWDTFLVIWSDVAPETIGNYDTILAEALDLKSRSLGAVERSEEAEAVDVELVERFSLDADPNIAVHVDLAMARRALALLNRRGSAAEALAVIDTLAARLDAASEAELAERADLLLTLSRALLGVFPNGLTSLVGGPAELALNVGADSVASLARLIDSRLPLPVLSELVIALGHRTPALLIRHRRRIAQAIDVAERVQTRLGDSDDAGLAAIERQANLMAALGRVFLGNPVAGFREVWNFEAGNDPAVVTAFTRLAAVHGRQPHWNHQLEAAAFLSLRARALVGDDPRLARIAYDDSIAEYLPERLSPQVRLLIRLIRPGAQATT